MLSASHSNIIKIVRTLFFCVLCISSSISLILQHMIDFQDMRHACETFAIDMH